MTDSDKIPRPLQWIGYLAITLLTALPLAVLTVRSGAWQQGLLLFALSCLGATLIVLLSAILLALPRCAPWRGAIARRAALALPGALLLFSLLANRGDVPPIHDITTDTADPPAFTAAALERRGSDSNPLAISAATIAAQRVAYPDLDTLVTGQPIEAAFARAAATAESLGWQIYHRDLNAGIIEAVAATPVMGFKDDVVIRLRTHAEGTLVDLRSVSRVGVSDLGANAARIGEFIQAFELRD